SSVRSEVKKRLVLPSTISSERTFKVEVGVAAQLLPVQVNISPREPLVCGIVELPLIYCATLEFVKKRFDGPSKTSSDKMCNEEVANGIHAEPFQPITLPYEAFPGCAIV